MFIATECICWLTFHQDMVRILINLLHISCFLIYFIIHSLQIIEMGNFYQELRVEYVWLRFTFPFFSVWLMAHFALLSPTKSSWQKAPNLEGTQTWKCTLSPFCGFSLFLVTHMTLRLLIADQKLSHYLCSWLILYLWKSIGNVTMC